MIVRSCGALIMAQNLAFFVGINSVSSGAANSLTIQLPANTRAGDLVMIYVVGHNGAGGISGGAGGWSRISVAADDLHWKIAAAGDLATNLTVTNDQCFTAQALAYRDCSAVAAKTSVFSGVSPASITGFTKSANHRGAITFANVAVAGRTLAVSSGFTLRGSNISNPNSPESTANVADIIDPPYASGAAVTWTSGSDNMYAQLYELTGTS